MRHPFDLANLVAGDHRLAGTLFDRLESGQGDRQVLVDQMGLNVAVHAGFEEQMFYPALRTAGCDAVADDNLKAHQVVTDALVVLDRHDGHTPEAEQAVTTVIAAVLAHAADEEGDELPQLRALVGEDRMLALGLDFMAVARKAPTHAHPGAAFVLDKAAVAQDQAAGALQGAFAASSAPGHIPPTLSPRWRPREPAPAADNPTKGAITNMRMTTKKLELGLVGAGLLAAAPLGAQTGAGGGGVTVSGTRCAPSGTTRLRPPAASSSAVTTRSR